MTTAPINTLLNPINPSIKSTLEYFSTLIDENINFGTHVLAWHLQSARGGDEITPISLSIRHILELLGAISSCIKNSNIDPCKILLRASLESFLGLAYLLEEDSMRRGFAFLTVEAHQRLKQMKTLDASTSESKTLSRKMSGDTIVPGFSPNIPQEFIRNSITNIEEYLQTPGAKEASDELKRLKSKNKKNNPSWYSLYGGPSNLEQLATKLGYQSLYYYFYRYWSRSTHGVDVIQGKLGLGPSGRPGIVQLRIPANAQTFTEISITIAIRTFRLVIDKYCPNKTLDLRAWYIREMQKPFLHLGEEQLINIVVPNGTVPA